MQTKGKYRSNYDRYIKSNLKETTLKSENGRKKYTARMYYWLI